MLAAYTSCNDEVMNSASLVRPFPDETVQAVLFTYFGWPAPAMPPLHPRLGKRPVPLSKMVLTETLRHKDLSRFSQEFLTPIAEQSLCLGIRQHDSSRLVNDDHRIGRRFQEPAEQRIIRGKGSINRFHPKPHRGHTDPQSDAIAKLQAGVPAEERGVSSTHLL